MRRRDAVFRWYVIQERGGKYDDGCYGWDSRVHSDGQIHREDEMPYMPCPEYQRILVGEGATKPSLETVCRFLSAREEVLFRAQGVVDKALGVFWQSVAASFPELASGAPSEAARAALHDEALSAVGAWFSDAKGRLGEPAAFQDEELSLEGRPVGKLQIN